MMNIIVLSGSVRRGGNTEALAQAFQRGAEAGNTVEILSVADLCVHPCTGCNACQQTPEHRCCQRDDMDAVYAKLQTADALVIATPVYFYGVSAQLKAVIDRLHNPIRNTLPIRRMALIAVAANTLPRLFDAITAQYQLVLDFFHLEDMGRVLIGGTKERGAVLENPAALQQAFELGRAFTAKGAER